MLHLYGVRSIQEYVQEIGRYRAQQEQALCISFMSNDTINRLYSSLFLSAVNPMSIRRFVNDIMQDSEKVFTFICFKFAEQKYDIPEAILRTILILLENHGYIRLDIDFNNHCIITPIDSNAVLLNNSMNDRLFRNQCFSLPFFISVTITIQIQVH